MRTSAFFTVPTCGSHQQPQYPRDCKEIYDQCNQNAPDGTYLIQPDDSPEPFKVYCNNNIDGGGWTVCNFVSFNKQTCFPFLYNAPCLIQALK